MTLKAITKICYGNSFSDDDEVRKMSNIYQKVLEYINAQFGI